MSHKKGKRYNPSFKLQVVLDSLDPNNTLIAIMKKYDLSKSTINSWRKQFFKNAHLVFDNSLSKKPSLSESPQELKRIIGRLTVELEILKKTFNLTN